MQKKLPQKLAMHSSLQFDDEHWQIANHEKWKTKKLSSWVVPLWGVIFVPWTLLDSFGESIMIRAPAKPFKTHINNNANAPQSTTRHIRLLKRHEATYSTRGHLFSEHILFFICGLFWYIFILVLNVLLYFHFQTQSWHNSTMCASARQIWPPSGTYYLIGEGFKSMHKNIRAFRAML